MLRRYRQGVRISGKIAIFSIMLISGFNLLLIVYYMLYIYIYIYYIDIQLRANQYVCR